MSLMVYSKKEEERRGEEMTAYHIQHPTPSTRQYTYSVGSISLLEDDTQQTNTEYNGKPICDVHSFIVTTTTLLYYTIL